ncbi:unnamed protein product (macronuclear) [Paramecium tetraurelia]|uniref:Uncharacterized protein n=1 Tax=Paramecium tetraurelia TaxID=5888 RepID=A0D1F8_PARTE|nr:uncharacterized protein GSPATT00012399001 [Paramecium tetraurelia]CAK76875.1 unnamed protein product [Paramecium tetraurelia]|eukprot:XP_001444272.1 hypothetical protein (macronuclear) [Paramecium tetraurelia strain d4-2]
MAKYGQFDSPYAKVFFLLQQLLKEELITQTEKEHLKDLIIQNDQSIKNLIVVESYQELYEQVLQFINNKRVSLEGLSDFEDDDSTSKSLRHYLRNKLKLEIKQSNFNLAIKKI